MTTRHLAWFRQDTGDWIGEWSGRVPMPLVASDVTGPARVMVMNEWLQQVQSRITPSGSPYLLHEQCWDLDAWDDCPPGGAVCLDVTMYGWPVGDFQWAVFDGVDRLIDFREMRTYLEVTPQTAMLDAMAQSPRPIRSTLHKLVADITGTPLEPFAGQLFGQFVRRDGRLVFEPSAGSYIPEGVVLSMSDRNLELAPLLALDPSVISLSS